ncbi:uncharacterized protein LOC143034218 [Oratosquilla oratoria]|uniref:uncharacterized protein LOC143034218 n=1 Tax=Oratosquilla oratoria TaxID=337810 RepID=UPI003F76B12A
MDTFATAYQANAVAKTRKMQVNLVFRDVRQAFDKTTSRKSYHNLAARSDPSRKHKIRTSTDKFKIILIQGRRKEPVIIDETARGYSDKGKILEWTITTNGGAAHVRNWKALASLGLQRLQRFTNLSMKHKKTLYLALIQRSPRGREGVGSIIWMRAVWSMSFTAWIIQERPEGSSLASRALRRALIHQSKAGREDMKQASPPRVNVLHSPSPSIAICDAHLGSKVTWTSLCDASTSYRYRHCNGISSMQRYGVDLCCRRGFERIIVIFILVQVVVILLSDDITGTAEWSTKRKQKPLKPLAVFPKARAIEASRVIKSNDVTPERPRPGVFRDSEDQTSAASGLDDSHVPVSDGRPSKVIQAIQQVWNSEQTEDRGSNTVKRRETTPFNIFRPGVHTLRDDRKIYFHPIKNGKACYVFGTDPSSLHEDSKKCICNEDYFGEDCGIPSSAWLGFFAKDKKATGVLTRREVPRRVINAFPVNHEYVMFEARMHELYDTIDVFVICESNYTAHGDYKKPEFFERLNGGYMQQFQDKMMYVFLGFFPKQAKENGWIADHYIRYYMGIESLPYIKGLRDDDLVVLNDADEIPTKELITFLKLYDGYPEPVGFGFRWNVFGFFWKRASDKSVWNWLSRAKEKLSVAYSAATIGMLREVLRNNMFFIRKEDVWKHYKLKKDLETYRANGHVVANWVAGIPGHYAGWHCSWCFDVNGLVRKMEAAQVNDTPRWGDFPQKKNHDYLHSLIVEGRWFDDTTEFVRTNVREPFYAPPYLMQNPGLYREILFHPSTL